MQPDLGYIDSEGKLRDDGLHDAMLDNPEADAAIQKVARDAAIKDGVSKAAAERFYGKYMLHTHKITRIWMIPITASSRETDEKEQPN